MDVLRGKQQRNKRNNKFSQFREEPRSVAAVTNTAPPPNSNLILIQGVSDGLHDLRILIDTASQCELISSEAVQRLGKDVTKSQQKLVSAQGRSMAVVGETELSLNIGQDTYPVKAVVTPRLCGDYDVILGITFLNTFKTTLVTTPGKSPKFSIDGNTIPLLRQKPHKNMSVFTLRSVPQDSVEFVRSAHYQKIEPRCMGFIKLSVPVNVELQNKKIHFQPLGDDDSDMEETIDEDCELELKEGLIKIKCSGNGKYYAYLPFVNHSSFSKTVRTGDILGTISIVDLHAANEQQATGVDSIPTIPAPDPVVDKSALGSISQPKNLPSIVSATAAPGKYSKVTRWALIKEMLKGKCDSPDIQARLEKLFERFTGLV